MTQRPCISFWFLTAGGLGHARDRAWPLLDADLVSLEDAHHGRHSEEGAGGVRLAGRPALAELPRGEHPQVVPGELQVAVDAIAAWD